MLFNKFIVLLQKGYAEHLISVISEWIMVFAVLLTLLTFLPDFEKVKIVQRVYRSEPWVINSKLYGF